MKQVFILSGFSILGFGTSPFLNYSYAPVGEKAVKNTPKLAKNLTLCATISTTKVEVLRFFSDGGTRMEVFEEYFSFLAKHLTKSYPDKRIVIVMDNLYAHKCHLIIKTMQHFPMIRILYTPSCTPM